MEEVLIVEQATDPALPVARQSRRCSQCSAPGVLQCESCRVALCARHAVMRIVAGERMTVCADHAGRT